MIINNASDITILQEELKKEDLTFNNYFSILVHQLRREYRLSLKQNINLVEYTCDLKDIDGICINDIEKARYLIHRFYDISCYIK